VNQFAHIAVLVARVLIACLGFLLIYIALFLHEDEEGKLQNRLEELWVRIDDLQEKALSKQTVFLQELLRLLNRAFDTLLGEKLFSLRSITVSFCYSWASAMFLENCSIRLRTGARGVSIIADVLDWLWPVLLFALGTVAGALKGKLYTDFMMGLWGFIAGWFCWALWPQSHRTYLLGNAIFFGALLLGLICDIAFVALSRRVFRVVARLNKGTTIILVLLANVLVAILYAAPFYYWWFIYTIVPPGFLVTVSSTNLIAVCCALSIILVMLIALIHRLLWPVVSRPVYAMGRGQLVRQPKLLLSVAIVLLTWAIPAWKTSWEFIGKH
jgi:hypothetical protein